MENKKIIKISIIVLIVMFSFAFIEIGIKALAAKITEFSETRKEEKKAEEIYNSDESKLERQIRTFIANICDAIKDEDYEYVMLSLNENYSQYMFNKDINNLKTFIQENIMIGAEYEIVRVELKGAFYEVLVGIQTGEQYKSNTFTVEVIDENTFSLMFGSYTKFKPISEKAYYSDLQYEIVYYYETTELMTYVIDIKNISEINYTMKFKNTTQYACDGEMFEGTLPKDAELKPNEHKKIEVTFKKRSEAIAFLQLNIEKNAILEEIKIHFEEEAY